MIIKLPSRFCLLCKGRGFTKRETRDYRREFVLVCPKITKNGKSEVMTRYNFNKRISKIKKRGVK